MSAIPFSVYDFFAYLSSGVVAVAVVDHVVGWGLLGRDHFTSQETLLLVLVAYVSGHAIAHLSQVVLEEWFVGRLLKRPARTLMGERAPRVLAWLFPAYFRPLDAKTQERVRAQAKTRGFTGHGEALFQHAYGVVTAHEARQRRLDEFRNLYGFSRNMGFVFLTTALALPVAARLAIAPAEPRAAIVAALLGVVLLYRYLKFFRHYAWMLLVAYAGLPAAGEEQAAET